MPTVFFFIAIGFLGGGWLSWQAARTVLKGFLCRGANPRVVRAFIVVGLLLGSVPAGFIAYFVGGTFGGAYGSAISVPWGSFVGVALGIAFALVVCALGVAFVSGLLGTAFASAASRKPVSEPGSTL